MPNFNITAVSTSTSTVAQGTEKRFPAIMDLPDITAAQNTATMYAKLVNRDDYLGFWNWTGNATPAP